MEVEVIEVEEVRQSCDVALDTLVQLCKENAEALQPDESEAGQRLGAAFLAMTDHIETLRPSVDKIRAVAPLYDFSPETPGNGYRSFVNIVDTFVMHGLKLAREVATTRSSLFFRKSFFMKEVEACSHVMASLGTCLQHLVTLIDWSETGNLFPDDKHSPAELLARAQNINQYCFYGRCLGFQFCESMRKALQFICIAMASYSEAYYNTGGLLSKATNSVVTGSKYLLDPELRARRIVNIAQYSNVEFCKSFWQLTETDLMQKLPSFVTPPVAVNQEISIPPQSFTVKGVNGDDVVVPAPFSHIGPKPVLVRLISAHYREGMLGKTSESVAALPPTPQLIVHCHGGGFVAQSSRSHECYLRDWANRLNVPILSIDYSLAPSAPYPRALEEVLYAYCWARQNCQMLGSTGERVILVGDSAGANLNLGATLKCIDMGLPLPDGLFLAYVPVLVAFIPSPARLLCLMDPLLPFGFMMRCLKAYAGHLGTDNKKVEQQQSIDDLPLFEGQIPVKEVQEETSPNQNEDDNLTELPLRSPSKVSDQGSDSLTSVSLVSPAAQQPEDSAAARSRKYVAQFLDRYVQNGKNKEEDEQDSVLFEAPQMEESPQISPSFSERISSMASSFTGHFSAAGSRTMSREPSQEAACGSPALPMDPSELDQMLDLDPTEEFKFTVPKDPYLSPYFATDDILKQLPPVKIISLQLDPCLDDCVMLARRLKNLGNDVQLDVLDSLPHGFLNFSLISKEAQEGSKLCVKRIKVLLGCEEVDEVDG